MWIPDLWPGARSLSRSSRKGGNGVVRLALPVHETRIRARLQSGRPALPMDTSLRRRLARSVAERAKTVSRILAPQASPNHSNVGVDGETLVVTEP